MKLKVRSVHGSKYIQLLERWYLLIYTFFIYIQRESYYLLLALFCVSLTANDMTFLSFFTYDYHIKLFSEIYLFFPYAFRFSKPLHMLKPKKIMTTLMSGCHTLPKKIWHALAMRSLKTCASQVLPVTSK